MTLVRWNPAREFEDLFGRYGRLFNGLLPTIDEAGTGESVQWRPAANIVENDKEYLIKAELPEVEKKDVQLTVHEGVITIRGERRRTTASRPWASSRPPRRHRSAPPIPTIRPCPERSPTGTTFPTPCRCPTRRRDRSSSRPA